MIALLLAACGGGGGDPVATSLAPWPDDPVEILAQCDAQPFPELATTCRVQAAARFARRGDAEQAGATCADVPEGTWREECHFRVGEELGSAGELLGALGHCREAGWFARNCLTHAVWHLPPDQALGADTDPAVLAEAADALLAKVDATLAGAGDGLPGEGHDLVLARFGYNVYVGRGSANPAPARLPGDVGDALRTGFGAEAARLLEPPTVEAIEAVWQGDALAPTGAALPEPARLGRYSTPILPPHEIALPHLPLYGGGMRLRGETDDEDAVIAALEGLYWRVDVDAEVFLPWVDDPRPRVAWTAARLLRLCQSGIIDVEATVQALTSHPDEGVRWHAEDALRRRTWEPGPRRR